MGRVGGPHLSKRDTNLHSLRPRSGSGMLSARGHFLRLALGVLTFFTFLCKAVDYIDFRLSCHVGGNGDYGFLTPMENLTLRCHLVAGKYAKGLDLIEMTRGMYGTFTTTIANSTFHRVFEWEASAEETNLWKFTIDRSNLFDVYSDHELPKTYRNSALKWSLTTVFNSPLLPEPLTDGTEVMYVATDPAYRLDWGDPTFDGDADLVRSGSRIYASLPCQPGSGLLIFSSATRTILAATWDAFKSEDFIKWYDITSSLQKATASDTPLSVHQAVFSSQRLLLVTSKGVVASAPFSSMCWEASTSSCRKVSFLKINAPTEVENVNWRSADLVYSTLCSNLDQVSLSGDRIFLKIRLKTTLKILELVHPSLSWHLVADLPSASDTSVFYDAQSEILHAIVSNKSKTFDTSFYNDNVVWKSLKVDISLPGFNPINSYALSSVFVFLVGNDSVVYCYHGGTSYSNLFSLKPGEKVVGVVAHERTKSIAFLLNDGKILVKRGGVSKLFESRSRFPPPSIATYGNDGYLYASSITWNDEMGRPQIETLPFARNDDERCSVKLVPHNPALIESLVYLDVGDEFVLKATGLAELSGDHVDFPLLEASVSNSRLLQTRIELTDVTKFSQQIDITISNFGHVQGTGSVIVMLRKAEPSCLFTSFSVTIAFSCPPRKQLVFDYSSFVEPDSLLSLPEFTNLSANFANVRLLEKNYRPPSALGISIPLSKNIYNFDPTSSQGSRLLDYNFTEEYGVSDHCKGTGYDKCECSSAMRFSSLERFTDCRQRVYEVKYDIEYHINVSVVDDSEITSKKFNDEEYLVYLEELNGRGEDIYSITDGNSRLCVELNSHGICNEYSSEAGKEYHEKVKAYSSHGTGKTLYNVTKLTIRFLGTGLFHFRIVLAQGYSHCKLQDEFQVYVTNPPLPFPVGTIVRLTVSVAMGAALVMIYIKSLKTQLPKVTPAQELVPQEKPRALRRINASHVNEGDVANLRNKFRASFQANQK